MKKIVRLAAALLAAVTLLAGCSGGVDPSNIDYIQLRAPEEGQDIAIMDTTLGEITFLLYTEEVPTVVQNFKDLVNEGFFDGQVIYQVVPTAGAVLFGSETDDGMSPDTNTGKPIEAEYSDNLWPFTGAVCALCGDQGQFLTRKTYFDSRSFFVAEKEIDEETRAKMVENYFPAMMMNAFEDLGGAPGLSQYHTVFGKVIQGMDVVNAIASADMTEIKLTEEEKAQMEDGVEYETPYRPTEDVVINSVTLSTYHAEDYETLDNTYTEEEYQDLVQRSEIDQAAIDEAIQDGTYGQSDTSAESGASTENSATESSTESADSAESSEASQAE